jgi:uncharacterized MnhB-related membrane protein
MLTQNIWYIVCIYIILTEILKSAIVCNSVLSGLLVFLYVPLTVMTMMMRQNL